MATSELVKCSYQIMVVRVRGKRCQVTCLPALSWHSTLNHVQHDGSWQMVLREPLTSVVSSCVVSIWDVV